MHGWLHAKNEPLKAEQNSVPRGGSELFSNTVLYSELECVKGANVLYMFNF
jgi:hypothetical protein